MANLSDILTNYQSVDTLDSVTDRGATTTNALTIGNLTSTGIDDNATSTAITIDTGGNASFGLSSVSPIISSTKTIQVASTGNTTLSVRSTDGVNDRSAILELLSSGNGVSKSIILYGDTDTSPSSPSPLVFQKYHSGARAEVARFTSTGNLRLGDSTPAFIDIKSGTGTNNGGIRWRFNSDSSVYGSLSLPYDTRGTTGLHLYSGYPITYTVPSTQAHQFVIGSAEVARIDADGLKMASGKGIDFSANSNASGMTSELLDDYEEGTWTPSYSTTSGSFSAITYSYQQGWYTKVGNHVTAGGRIILSAYTQGTASGNVFINLPFTIKAAYFSGTMMPLGGWTGYVPNTCYGNPSNANIFVMGSDWGSSSVVSITPAMILSSADVIFTISYTV